MLSELKLLTVMLDPEAATTETLRMPKERKAAMIERAAYLSAALWPLPSGPHRPGLAPTEGT